MSSLRKRRQFLYPVGLISVAILPILLLWHLAQTDISRPKATIEVNVPPTPAYVKALFQKYPLIAPNGQWTTFAFTADPKANASTLDSVQGALRRHHSQNDTLNGIKISFSRGTRFDTFVNVLDFLDLNGISRYLTTDSTVWVARQIMQSEIDTTRYTGFLCGGVVSAGLQASVTRQVRTVWDSYGSLNSRGHGVTLGAIAVCWFAIGCVNVLRLHRVRSERRPLMDNDPEG